MASDEGRQLSGLLQQLLRAFSGLVLYALEEGGIVVDQRDLTFVIPTYRLRDVGETVEQYDQHFWRNGHALPMIVFDDSTPSTQEKYYPILEQTGELKRSRLATG